MIPSFKIRTNQDELMDDFSINDSRLTSALEELRIINQWLSGYSTTMQVLAPFLSSRKTTRILDLGTGIADFPEYIVRWAMTQSPPLDVEIVAIDANPVTVEYAQKTLKQRLDPQEASKISVEVADALALRYEDNSFDVVISALFLHHFAEPNAVTVVKNMQRVARCGILINDLHRHPLAYYSFYTLSHLLPASEMVRNDGPLSVLRGFERSELEQIATEAGLKDFSLSWYFPFRWLLTTIKI